MDSNTLEGFYTFTEDLLIHSQNSVLLYFKEEDVHSKNGLALYMKRPEPQRIGRLFKRKGYYYFDHVLSKSPKGKPLLKAKYKLIQEGLSGYRIEPYKPKSKKSRHSQKSRQGVLL